MTRPGRRRGIPAIVAAHVELPHGRDPTGAKRTAIHRKRGGDGDAVHVEMRSCFRKVEQLDTNALFECQEGETFPYALIVALTEMLLVGLHTATMTENVGALGAILLILDVVEVFVVRPRPDVLLAECKERFVRDRRDDGDTGPAVGYFGHGEVVHAVDGHAELRPELLGVGDARVGRVFNLECLEYSSGYFFSCCQLTREKLLHSRKCGICLRQCHSNLTSEDRELFRRRPGVVCHMRVHDLFLFKEYPQKSLRAWLYCLKNCITVL